MQQPKRSCWKLVLTLSAGGLYDGIFCVLVLIIGYFLELLGSIRLYRAFFHPLRNSSGPPLAKLSPLWSAREIARNYRFHVMIDEMHRTYGEFVRIRMPFLFISLISIMLRILIVLTL
jgi:hypothetical protein